MLKHFGSLTCPRCETDLVHESELSGDWVLPVFPADDDQRWICPQCGFNRPVVYSVERTRGMANAPRKSFSGVIRPLTKRFR
jgi:transposase-like protein